ncbi:MAG TPA: branched-chain amino acid ABC transporter permease [Gaiellaceae bacterium]|nr:branched-chain amino acid ABC transporter permease [Gaiellaceae bacterium]
MATPTHASVAARTRPLDVGRLLQGGLAGLLVLAFLAWVVVNFVEAPSDSTNVILIGITLGCLYALIALGYTLVYGILELINFAHGDVFMLGGMITSTLVGTVFGLGAGSRGVVTWLLVVAALLIAMIFCGVVNATIEFIAYRPLRSAPRLAPLLTAIGVSFILEDIALAIWGPNFVSVPQVFPESRLFTFHGIVYEWDKLIVVLITVPVLLALVWLVQYTKQGKAMRATAQDMDAAAMMGINVNRTVSFTFLIAGGLAGAAGLLYALYVTNLGFQQGFQLGLIAFTAAVFGGIGNLPGAVLGAVLIGLIQAMNEGFVWHAPGSDWTQSIVFSILILILVFRPEGLLGEQVQEGG